MAKNDIRIVDVGGKNTVPVITCNTEAAATAIKTGEPVIYKTAGSKYVIPMADATPVIGTTVAMVGIAASDSSHTASADGTVEVYLIDSTTVLRAKAKSAAAADTVAEVIALKGKRTVLDLTSSTYTIDTAASDGATSGFVIVGGDADTSSIDFIVRPGALTGPIA
jgi:hypothetical protein